MSSRYLSESSRYCNCQTHGVLCIPMFKFNTEQTCTSSKFSPKHTHTQSMCHQAACPRYTALHLINMCLCAQNLFSCALQPHSQLTHCNTEPLQLFPSGLWVRTERSAENELASQSLARFILNQFNSPKSRSRPVRSWMKLHNVSKNRRLATKTH